MANISIEINFPGIYHTSVSTQTFNGGDTFSGRIEVEGDLVAEDPQRAGSYVGTASLYIDGVVVRTGTIQNGSLDRGSLQSTMGNKQYASMSYSPSLASYGGIYVNSTGITLTIPPHSREATITLGSTKTCNLGVNGFYHYKFVPTQSGTYSFTPSSGICGWISTSKYNYKPSNASTSKISQSLSAGKTYYISVTRVNQSSYWTTVKSSVTLSFTPPDTQITYISGTSSIKKTYSNSSFNLDSISSLGFTKSGWSFKGWATSTGTSNVTYSNGGSYTGAIGQAATLYAVWEKTITATLYSGLNNAAISSVQGRLSSYNTSNSNTYEDTIAYINLPNNSLNFSYDNRQFTPNDWGLLSDNNYTFYPQNSSVSISGGENFYLRYVNNALTLSYDKNSEEAIGQIESQVSLQTYINNNFSEVNFTIAENTFENKKQSFNGFSTAADGADEIYQPNGIITISKNTTLYAIWGAMASTSSPFYYNGKSCLLFLRKNNKYYPIILGVSSNGE